MKESATARRGFCDSIYSSFLAFVLEKQVRQSSVSRKVGSNAAKQQCW